MCGILAVHGLQAPAVERSRFIALSKRLRHRGPDWSGCYIGKESILVHERLAIVGVGMSLLCPYCSHDTTACTTGTGAQPLISQDGKVILTVNGEIYNHLILRASMGPEVKFKTHSDCEVIMPLVYFHDISPSFYPLDSWHSSVR
jgi:asparagine synthase (glutamine-hydrolysing)